MAMSILEIQKALKAAGFDPGPLDGVSGPKTLAALTAYQKAKGLSQAQDQWGATESALRGTAPAAGTETFQSKYPQFAWAFSDPDVRKLLEEGVANKWGPEELQGKIQQTNWWKTKTNAERDWLQTLATNPAEATRELNNYDSITKYIGMAARYGQTVSFEAAARQVNRVNRGEIAPDALEQELRINAKALFPYLAQQIDAGGNVEAVFEPIRNMVSQVLGVNEATVTLADAKWRSLLTKDDGNGKLRLATENEIMQTIKFDDTYGYRQSTSGRESAAAGVNAIREGFGFRG